MIRMIKSGLYKLFKDKTFKVTLIIGAALAVFMNLLYVAIGALADDVAGFCNGQTFFISSLSPTQNFGLTVPINLVIFTVAEFNHGTIRNKIIAGNKRSEIYLSLFLIGLIFTISLMTIYFGVSVGIASLIGGFDVNGTSGMIEGLNSFMPEYLYQYSLMALATYIFIVSLAIFFSVNFQNIGGTISLTIIIIMFLYFAAFVPSVAEITDIVMGQFEPSPMMYFNPLYTFGAFSLVYPTISSEWFAWSLITPLYWTVILIFLGIVTFNKKDLK